MKLVLENPKWLKQNKTGAQHGQTNTPNGRTATESRVHSEWLTNKAGRWHKQYSAKNPPNDLKLHLRKPQRYTYTSSSQTNPPPPLDLLGGNATCGFRESVPELPHHLQVERAGGRQEAVVEDVHEQGAREHDPPPAALRVVVLPEGEQLAEVGDEAGGAARRRLLRPGALRPAGFHGGGGRAAAAPEMFFGGFGRVL